MRGKLNLPHPARTRVRACAPTHGHVPIHQPITFLSQGQQICVSRFSSREFLGEKANTGVYVLYCPHLPVVSAPLTARALMTHPGTISDWDVSPRFPAATHSVLLGVDMPWEASLLGDPTCMFQAQENIGRKYLQKQDRWVRFCNWIDPP